MRIGYACMNLDLGTRTRTCRLANATPERVVELARANLQVVEDIARWNMDNGLHMFRITSNLVPFGSHPCSGDWRASLADDLARAGDAIRACDQRVSTHPGQFVVLGTRNEKALAAALAELDYQADVLDLMGVEAEMVIHLGGAYGEPEAAIDRFVARALALPANVRRRLVVENDDTVFNVASALRAGRDAALPVVFDVLHHELRPTPGLTLREAVEACLGTWDVRPRRLPKIHYSDAEPEGQRGMHARRVNPEGFAAFLAAVEGLDFDVMVEAKDKERAVIPLLPVVQAWNAHPRGGEAALREALRAG